MQQHNMLVVTLSFPGDDSGTELRKLVRLSFPGQMTEAFISCPGMHSRSAHTGRLMLSARTHKTRNASQRRGSLVVALFIFRSSVFAIFSVLRSVPRLSPCSIRRLSWSPFPTIELGAWPYRPSKTSLTTDGAQYSPSGLGNGMREVKNSSISDIEDRAVAEVSDEYERIELAWKNITVTVKDRKTKLPKAV